MVPKKQGAASVEPEADVTEPEAIEEGLVEETETPASMAKDSVTVTWNGGKREFSKAVHGKDFRKLAQKSAESDDRDGVVA